MLRMVGNAFSATTPPTIGVDCKVKYVDIDGISVQLDIHDTGATKKYNN